MHKKSINQIDECYAIVDKMWIFKNLLNKNGSPYLIRTKNQSIQFNKTFHLPFSDVVS